MSVDLEVDASLKLSNLYVDSDDLSAARGNLFLSWTDELADGTGTDQADLLWYDSRTANAAVDDLDLAGSLTDAFGNTLTFVEVRGLYIRNKDSANPLAIGAAAANPVASIFSDTSDEIIVRAGGVLFLWSPLNGGYTIGAGASDILRIDPGANSIDYDIVIIGTSA